MTVIESKLTDIASLVLSMADLTENLDMTGSAQLDEVSLSLPIELEEIVNEDGSVVLNSSPPTQQVETSFMPVFHQMKIKVIAVDANS